MDWKAEKTMKNYIKEINKLAKRAFDKKEIPVGAIVVDDSGKIIGRGYNLAIHTKILPPMLK